MSTMSRRNPATPKRGVSVPGSGGLRPLSRLGVCLSTLLLGFTGTLVGQSVTDVQAGLASPTERGEAVSQVAEDVAQVEAVAEALLQGISEGNGQLLEDALHPAAYLMAVPDEGTARRQERVEFIQSVGDSGGRYLERMWEPRTEVSGPVATVWAPYDFHIDGQFSHCGIDAFQLIRQEDRWVILSVVYTMRRGDDCEPSPLGPPGD